MGFEPTRAEHNGLAVHRLNHSATLSDCFGYGQKWLLNYWWYYRMNFLAGLSVHIYLLM